MNKLKINESKETIKLAQSQIEQLENDEKLTTWKNYAYRYYQNPKFSEEYKSEVLTIDNIDYEDAVGIFTLIVKDLNKGWKPNFKSPKWEDWGYCIYHSLRNGGVVDYGVNVVGFFWLLHTSTDGAARNIGARPLFKSKELAEKAIAICGEDFLNLLFE
jgi:phenylalanyl-tRNA synthetase beta subunit